MAVVRLLRANLVAFRSPSALQENEALPQLLDVLQKLVISPFGAEVTSTGKVTFCPSLCYIFISLFVSSSRVFSRRHGSPN